MPPRIGRHEIHRPLVTFLKVTTSRHLIMSWDFTTFLLLALAALLVWAAIGDLRTREIPNWLNGAIALLAIPYWFALGLPLWPDAAIQIGIATAIFLIFAFLFHIGAMGGGDVKMITAIALWLPLNALVLLLLIMSIAGGALTAAMLIHNRMRKNPQKLEVPYGVAIAFGTFWVFCRTVF